MPPASRQTPTSAHFWPERARDGSHRRIARRTRRREAGPCVPHHGEPTEAGLRGGQCHTVDALLHPHLSRARGLVEALRRCPACPGTQRRRLAALLELSGRDQVVRRDGRRRARPPASCSASSGSACGPPGAEDPSWCHPLAIADAEAPAGARASPRARTSAVRGTSQPVRAASADRPADPPGVGHDRVECVEHPRDDQGQALAHPRAADEQRRWPDDTRPAHRKLRPGRIAANRPADAPTRTGQPAMCYHGLSCGGGT